MSGIQMALLGTGDNVVITLADVTVSDLDSSAAYAYYFLTSGGLVQESVQSGGGSPSTLSTWCEPTSAASDYEVLATVVTGTLSGGSDTGSWLPLSSTCNWFAQQTVIGTNIVEFTVAIRRIGTTTNLASAFITLNAEVI
jgi:hypothetical protein